MTSLGVADSCFTTPHPVGLMWRLAAILSMGLFFYGSFLDHTGCDRELLLACCIRGLTTVYAAMRHRLSNHRKSVRQTTLSGKPGLSRVFDQATKILRTFCASVPEEVYTRPAGWAYRTAPNTPIANPATDPA